MCERLSTYIQESKIKLCLFEGVQMNVQEMNITLNIGVLNITRLLIKVTPLQNTNNFLPRWPRVLVGIRIKVSFFTSCSTLITGLDLTNCRLW